MAMPPNDQNVLSKVSFEMAYEGIAVKSSHMSLVLYCTIFGKNSFDPCMKLIDEGHERLVLINPYHDRKNPLFQMDLNYAVKKIVLFVFIFMHFF